MTHQPAHLAPHQVAALRARAFRAYARGDLDTAQTTRDALAQTHEGKEDLLLDVAAAVSAGQTGDAWALLTQACAQGAEPRSDLELSLAADLAFGLGHLDEAARWSEAQLYIRSTPLAARIFFHSVAASEGGVSHARLLRLVTASTALPVYAARIRGLAFMKEIGFEDALDLINRLAERFPEDRKTEVARTKLLQIISIGAEDNALRIERAPDPDGVLLKFTGLGPPRTLNLTKSENFEAFPTWSKIVLYDPKVLCFLDGLDVLGPGFEASCARLAELLDELGPKSGPRVMTSSSSGGLGGLRFATRLKLDRAVCFSPVTSAEAATLAELGDTRAKIPFSYAERAFAHDPDRLDARKSLTHAEDLPDIRIIYGADRPVDVAHAERLRGIPGVTLHPLAGVRYHHSARHLKLAGTYADVLRGDYSCLTRQDWAPRAT